MSQVNGARGWRRRLASAAVVVVGAAMLAGCAGTSSSSGGSSAAKAAVERTAAPGKPVSATHLAHLKVGVGGEVTHLDPTKNIGGGGLYANTLGLESLLRIGSKGELEPWLAKSWKRVSDTVYEYRLREGVTFWDGAPLTSTDVKYSWDYLRSAKSSRAKYFAPVDRVDTPDAHTVRVTLKRPDASWQYTPGMWYSVIFEKKFREEHKAKFGQPGTMLMATGPWQFKSFNPTTGLELSAYAGYWGGKPPVDKISVKSFADDNSMALALRAGEIDITPTVNGPKGFDAAAGGNTVTTVPNCATALLSMPTRAKPWDDVHVRRAVAYAVDREQVVAATQGRAGGPLETLMSPIMLQTLGSKAEVDEALKKVPGHPHDLGKAKQEMARSKVPNGFTYDVKIPSSYTRQVQVVADQLKKIGIKLSIKTLGDTAWYGEIAKTGAKRPLTFTETGACTPDPSWDEIYLETDDKGKPFGLNLADYVNPTVTKKLKDGRTTQDPKQRLAIYTDVLKQLATDVPYVPLYSEGFTYASTKYAIVDYGSYWNCFPWVLNVVAK